MSGHIGTHLDCPSHMTASSLHTDSMELECFLGSGLVIDCRQHLINNEISAAVLEDTLLKNTPDYLLFYTGYDSHWGSESYFINYPILSRELATKLSAMQLKGIGVDVISVDPPSHGDYHNHKIVLGSGKIIVENLTNLEQLFDTKFEFYALPLKIEQGDGSPIRAVAVVRG